MENHSRNKRLPGTSRALEVRPRTGSGRCFGQRLGSSENYLCARIPSSARCMQRNSTSIGIGDDLEQQPKAFSGDSTLPDLRS